MQEIKDLIKKYRKRLRQLNYEYRCHAEADAYKTYIYGKILTYEAVIVDLKKMVGDTSAEN